MLLCCEPVAECCRVATAAWCNLLPRLRHDASCRGAVQVVLRFTELALKLCVACLLPWGVVCMAVYYYACGGLTDIHAFSLGNIAA